MLIEQAQIKKDCLRGQTVLITGAGGGIGFEAAKALAYMGANIIIAEIDRAKGIQAEQCINAHFPYAKSEFYPIDLSEEDAIRQMYDYILQKYGFIDVLFHNATITAMGNVEDVPIETWDKSYCVNFKAPLLLTQLVLPAMKQKNKGVIVFVPSSGAAPYMGAYEVFKTAQVELCNTLAGELEGSHISTYSIGPGLVKTDTAMRGIEIVSNKMGITVDEFYSMNQAHMLSAEEAGCGFAVSVLFAEKYNGQEIGSIQALLDSGLLKQTPETHCVQNVEQVVPLLNEIIDVYMEQYAGWQTRNIFERQWVLRDFKKTVGMPAEQFKSDMEQLKIVLNQKNPEVCAYKGHMEHLKQYFLHQHKLLQGFEKNPDKLKANSDILLNWVSMLEKVIEKI